MLRRARPVALVFAVSCMSTGAQELAAPPAFEPAGQTKCQVRKSHSEPLIVEWPSPARAKLEAQVRRGVVVVRYTGCEMMVLDGCRAPARYAYVGITRKQDTVRIRDEDELYASVPVYAARFAGELERNGELRVEMTIVGRWESDRGVSASELEGKCEGATHVLSGLTVGAFGFYAGARGSMGAGVSLAPASIGAGARRERQVLNRDGDPARCDGASISDGAPPDGCGAILRVEALALGQRKPARPACSGTEAWDGRRCVAPPALAPAPAEPPEPPAIEVSCPEGTERRGSVCHAQSFSPCPRGKALALGGGCVAELEPPSAVAPLASSARPAAARSVKVPGGSFLMGSYDGQKDERPPRRVTVATFFMDATEVTVDDYAACVARGGCRAREFDPACNWGQPSRGDHPMNCVRWEEAAAYCAWGGKRLPTEEEWEYAARGSQGRRYPWGAESPSGRVCWKPLLERGSTCRVGSYPAGATPLGILDLAGNVHEWTASTYCIADEGTAAGRRCMEGEHVHRGGSWEHPYELFVRATTRYRHASGATTAHGFRCARSDDAVTR